MGLLDSFNDKLGKYLGLKKQDVSVQIFEETVSSSKPDFPAKKKIGDVISEDEREKARKEALAQLEKEADE